MTPKDFLQQVEWKRSPAPACYRWVKEKGEEEEDCQRGTSPRRWVGGGGGGGVGGWGVDGVGGGVWGGGGGGGWFARDREESLHSIKKTSEIGEMPLLATNGRTRTIRPLKLTGSQKKAFSLTLL